MVSELYRIFFPSLWCDHSSGTSETGGVSSLSCYIFPKVQMVCPQIGGVSCYNFSLAVCYIYFSMSSEIGGVIVIPVSLVTSKNKFT